jgi:hypothetical protein
MCRVFKVSRSGYYSWVRRKPSLLARNQELIGKEIEVVYHKSKGRYGSPKIAKELKSIGLSVSRQRVAGIMKKKGPSIVLRVMAGDSVQIGAKAFYKSQSPQGNNNPAPVEDMLASLVQVFNESASSNSSHGAGSVDPVSPFANNFTSNDYQRLKQKDPDQQRSDKPKAYLSFVLFDDQFNLVEENSGVKQVQGEPDQLQTLAKDKMRIQKNGFLYVYTSNETPQDVSFDNVTVAQISGPVLEETHYYPFGLTMSGISSMR